ncbi:MAG: DUF29 domain-containing protein [Halothiobacillaceae bacterium]
MSTPYEQDFFAWTHEQAERLRTRDWSGIDIEHLIEEIEGMGRSEKRALESRLAVLLQHLLKWSLQAERRGASWQLTIDIQRDAIADLLSDNPSLRAKIDETLIHAYAKARRYAATETGLGLAHFPEECPWTRANVLSSDFLPDTLS